MCNHVFRFPEDTGDNYNHDGNTLTGTCRHCGAKQKAYGMRWAIPIEEDFLQQILCSESSLEFDKIEIIYIDKDEKDR